MTVGFVIGGLYPPRCLYDSLYVHHRVLRPVSFHFPDRLAGFHDSLSALSCGVSVLPSKVSEHPEIGRCLNGFPVTALGMYGVASVFDPIVMPLERSSADAAGVAKTVGE